MRFPLKAIFIILTCFILSSCIVEDSGHADYIIVNETDIDLVLEGHGPYMADYGYAIDDSAILFPFNSGSQLKFSYERMGGIPYPFDYVDSIIISNGEQVRVVYTHPMNGKNPFNQDYYEGGITETIKHTTYHEYFFRIQEENLTK